MSDKVVLAYSGGLDTSVSIKWIKEKYSLDVVTCTIDVGKKEDLLAAGEKARKIGAVDHFQIDAKEEFAKEYIFRSIKANSLYEGEYPNSTALARPLIATKLVQVADKVGAVAVAHGCTGKGNDQVRFDITVKALNPSPKILAPGREWNLHREDEIGSAQKPGISVSAAKPIFSTDQNLWGRSIEGGSLEDPSIEPPEEAFEWCVHPDNAPDKPEYLEIEFENGVPVAVDGKRANAVDLINYVNSKAGLNGYGIIDHVEDRLVGIKSREVYECPGALTIIKAHMDLEKLVLTRHELTFKSRVDEEWTWLVYSGLWVEPLRLALEKFIDTTQERVTGKVSVKLFKGSMKCVGRSSPNSLYQHALSTYDKSSTFDQNTALGFIELWGLPSTIASHMEQSNRKQAVASSENAGAVAISPITPRIEGKMSY